MPETVACSFLSSFSKIHHMRHLRPNMIDTTKVLRQNSTLAERILWEALRNRTLDGLKFRRQHQLDKFVIDFYCAELKLVIELDGSVHAADEAQFLDREREAALSPFVRHILRFKNSDVTGDLTDCLKKISEVAAQLSLK